LRWLRDHGSVTEAIAAATLGEVVEYTPRFHFMEEGGAVCVYNEDIAYDDLGRLEDPGPRHRLYLRDAAWEYQKSESA
jgi:hypothetical protein